MTTFEEFTTEAPELATIALERFAATGLTFVGTLRADGSPRISPMEPILFDGRLFVGSMPQAVKAQDLQRDGRCVMISTIADKHDRSPEVKLFCQATEVTEPTRLFAILSAAFAEMEGDYTMDDLDGSHVFELALTGAAIQGLDGETWITRSWTPGGGVRVRQRVGASGLSEDVT